MTTSEAQEKAALLDLEAREFAGWCCLWPVRGGAFVSRAQTWEEALARCRRSITPAAPASPFAVACSRCRVPAGQPCRNYRCQNKQTCTGRGQEAGPAPAATPAAAAPRKPGKPEQRSLFD